MKKLAIIIGMLLGLGLATAGPAQAAKKISQIDFGAMTCAQFLNEVQGDDEAAGLALMWLDGYLSGVSGDTVLDFKDFEKFAEKLGASCKKNGQANLLEVAKELGLGD
jgi:acid stress chaperone HdeB